jgi:hypothetical protein
LYKKWNIDKYYSLVTTINIDLLNSNVSSWYSENKTYIFTSITNGFPAIISNTDIIFNKANGMYSNFTTFGNTYYMIFKTSADVTTQQCLFSKVNNGGFSVYILNGTIKFFVYYSSTSSLIISNGAITANTSYLISFTLPSYLGGLACFLLGGVNFFKKNISTTVAINEPLNTNVSLGCGINTASGLADITIQPFMGNINAIYIYPENLHNQEIMNNIYNSLKLKYSFIK